MLVYLLRSRLCKLGLPAALVAFAVLAFSPAPARADICTPYLTGITFPGIVNGVTINQCTTDIVINAGGFVTITHNNTPYTNSGNALIGVINNSGNAVFDLYIAGFNSSSPGILQFASADSAEVLCATSLATRLACGNPLATSGDEGITSAGDIAYFTDISAANGANDNFGDVIFSDDLLTGQTAIFGALQDILSAQVSPVTVREPGSFALLAVGLLGIAFYRFRRAASRLVRQQP